MPPQRGRRDFMKSKGDQRKKRTQRERGSYNLEAGRELS